MGSEEYTNYHKYLFIELFGLHAGIQTSNVMETCIVRYHIHVLAVGSKVGRGANREFSLGLSLAVRYTYIQTMNNM